MLQAALYCVCPRHPHPIILLSYLHTYPHSLDLPKTSHVQLSSFTARRGGLVSSGPLRSSSAALSRARRAWRSSGRACEDATAHPSPGRATSRASYLDSTAQHSTPHCSALLCSATATATRRLHNRHSTSSHHPNRASPPPAARPVAPLPRTAFAALRRLSLLRLRLRIAAHPLSLAAAAQPRARVLATHTLLREQ